MLLQRIIELIQPVSIWSIMSQMVRDGGVHSQKGSISGPDERLSSCPSNHQEVCYSESCCQWRHFEFNDCHTASGTRETWWWRHSSLVSGSFAADIRITFEINFLEGPPSHWAIAVAFRTIASGACAKRFNRHHRHHQRSGLKQAELVLFVAFQNLALPYL